MSEHEDIVARAKRAAAGAAEAAAGHDDWGERIEANDTGDMFKGRYRGEVEDENYDGHGRRVHLAWDQDSQPCWIRGKWSLNTELDRVRPTVGDTLVIYVGDAWESENGRSGFYFGVEAEPNDAPLPGQRASAAGENGDDGIPFMPVL